MANQLWVDHGDDRLEGNSHPGCIWNIFNSLDYHQWHHHVKKILHHKKNHGQKQAKRLGNRRTKTKQNPYNSQEVEKLLAGESSLLHQAEQSSPKTSTTHKRSLKARIKALVSEENNKEKHHELRPRLQRTFSFHHLEPSDDRLSKVSRKWAHPIIFFPQNPNSISKFQDLVSHKQKNDAYTNDKRTVTQENCEIASGICTNQLEDYVSVLEIFNINKDLFQNHTQQVYDSMGKFLNGPQELKSKARLRKSGSFPVADMSQGIHLRPSKLKHKQSESWSFKKGDEFFTDRLVPKMVASNSTKGLHTKLGLLRGDDQEGNFSTSPSHNQENSQRNQQIGFELDNEENQENGFLLGSIQEFENQESNEENPECDGFSRTSLAHFRRTSSLNESMEKYTRLFDYTYSDKAKLNPSKSLKLTTEYEYSSGGNSIPLRNFWSLPHLDMLEESNDFHFSGNDKEKRVCVDDNREIDCVSSMQERGDISERLECAVPSEEGLNDKVILPDMEEFQKEMNSQEDSEKNPAEFRVSEYLEHIFVDENQLKKPNKDLSSDYFSTMCPNNFDNDKYVPQSQTHNIDLPTDDNTDFEYVKAILELSGFTDNGFDTTWHSIDHPLAPSVFEELEACWPQESECSSDHELLFDIVNEVLLEIYERSSPYYPKALSSTCKIRSMPLGTRVLEEVWRSIVGPKSVGQEAEVSLGSLVGQYFAKDDGWMNLQMESECVGLDIEDLIFDELLNELLS